MADLLLHYRACGAECREDWLRELANDNGLPFDCVRRLADRLGRARGLRGLAAHLRRAWEGCAVSGAVIGSDRTARIARLNDRARQAMGLACVAVATEGFRALPQADQSRVRELIETYGAFTPDNDPYGERDFGAIYKGGDGRWTTCYPVQGVPSKTCSGRSTPTTATCGSAVPTRPIPLLPGGCSPSCSPANIEGGGHGQAQAAGSRCRTRSEPDHHARRAAGQPWRAAAVAGGDCRCSLAGPRSRSISASGIRCGINWSCSDTARKFAARPRAGRCGW